MKYTGEQLRKQLWTLPESEQDYLLSEEVAEKIRKISDTQKLSPEQMGKLASTVGLVLLKLLKPTEFAHELAVELDIPPSKAAAVAGDVEREIFRTTSPASGEVWYQPQHHHPAQHFQQKVLGTPPQLRRG